MSENYQKCFDELTKISLEKRKLDYEHQRAGWALRHEVEPMPAKEFWEALELLRTKLWRYQTRWGWNLENALGSPMTNRLLAEKRTVLYRFMKKWKLVADSLREPLEAMDLEYRGDDSWGDLLDSSPLFGETICDQILKGAYKTEEELKAAFHTYCIMKQDGKNLDMVRKNADHMVRSVLNGENYFLTKMDDKALEVFTAHAE